MAEVPSAEAALQDKIHQLQERRSTAEPPETAEVYLPPGIYKFADARRFCQPVLIRLASTDEGAICAALVERAVSTAAPMVGMFGLVVTRDSGVDAIEDLKQLMVDRYASLSALPPEDIRPESRGQLELLKQYMREAETD